MRRLEEFVIGKTSDTKEVATEIITFYEEEFRNTVDADRLILHRNMALDLMKNSNLNVTPKCVGEFGVIIRIGELYASKSRRIRQHVHMATSI